MPHLLLETSLIVLTFETWDSHTAQGLGHKAEAAMAAP